MPKKKGSRYTPPKQQANCKVRSAHARKLLPHKFTSKQRTKIDGEWSPWTPRCSWCMTRHP